MSGSDRLQLPHTANCFVCGRGNDRGLKLDLFVDPSTGTVHTEFTTRPDQVGFEGVIHGGVIASIMDEAMVWAATWLLKRFVVCGELTVRFRSSASVGQKLRVESLVDFSRPKLVEPSAKLFDESGKLMATASGKYVPVAAAEHAHFVTTFIEDERTKAASGMLRGV